MILPEKRRFSEQEIEIINIPTKTFKLDFNKSRVRNLFDGIDALKQSIYKILMTERYKYSIYNWDYGIELENLIGMLKGYVKTEAERLIKEALLQDDRIENVYNFNFYDLKDDKSAILVEFFIKSIFGEFSIDWRLNI